MSIQRFSARAGSGAAIDLKLPHAWDHIRKIRKSVGEALEDYDPEWRAAAVMVTSELIENAVKYGEEVPAAREVRYSLRVEDGTARIVVVNGSNDTAGVAVLGGRIAEITASLDKAALYMARLEELLANPTESGKLGLYRIAFEGQFGLQFDYTNQVVTITATRSEG